jgi:hypothetical protein
VPFSRSTMERTSAGRIQTTLEAAWGDVLIHDSPNIAALRCYSPPVASRQTSCMLRISCIMSKDSAPRTPSVSHIRLKATSNLPHCPTRIPNP